ncbi:MAG: glycosyltransferase family 2 protein [Pseudomonadota bacterium]
MATVAVTPALWSRAVRVFIDVVRTGVYSRALMLVGRRDYITPADYQRYLSRRSARDQARVREATACVARASNTELPTFSILTPVWNPPPELLQAAIQSVEAQSYPQWRLILVDNASTRDGVADILDKAELHPQVTVVRLAENIGISGATNRAAELAETTHLTFLDHDDLLAADALLLIAAELVRMPARRLVYSDEDKIDEAGRRFSPYLKSQFDPLLLLGQNVCCHLTVVRRCDFDAVGGLRPLLDGAQDHDLLLRLTERLRPEEISHIPETLYHWRTHSASTSVSASAKPGASDATGRAVADALARRFPTGAAHAEARPNGHRQIIFSPPAPAPHVTIIIPTRNGADLLSRCLATLFARTQYPSFDVEIVDNASDAADAIELLETWAAREPERLRVHRDPRPFNFARMNNEAAERARGTVLCMMNNDIEVTDGAWLDRLVGALVRLDDAGAVGPRLLYPDGTVQHDGILTGFAGTAINLGLGRSPDDPGYQGVLDLKRRVSAVTAACMVTPRSTFLALGGFDAEHFPVAFNDVDYGLRLSEAGKQSVVCPAVTLVHHESATLGRPETGARAQTYAADVAAFKARWGAYRDPHYSPHLDLRRRPYLLAELHDEVA